MNIKALLITLLIIILCIVYVKIIFSLFFIAVLGFAYIIYKVLKHNIK